MTREEIYNLALSKIDRTKYLILELITGFGKTLCAINLINHICDKVFRNDECPTSILILVAKTVHKQTWKDEIEKWGGIKSDYITIECYESLKKYEGAYFDVVVADECFKGSTEILTDKGYKRFDCLEGNEKVAQFTDNGSIEFVNPIRFIKKDYEGKICKMHLGRNRYVYLTPNHNQVYRTNSVKEWRLRPVKDIKENYITKIPVSGKGTGNNSPLTPLEQLMIAIQADGTLSRHQKDESVYSIQVTKDRKKQRLKTILNNVDSSLWTSIKGYEGTDRYLVKLPKGDAKLLSTHFDVEMGYDRANSFIDEIVEWDGYKSSYKYYSSIIKENVDFVSAIAVQAGYKSLVSVEQDNRKNSYNSVYRVFIQKCEDKDTQCMNKEYLDYNDKVYCVEVPSSKIVVRSEGYTFISGNCQHLSENRMNILETIHINESFIGLSATIKKDMRDYFIYNHKAEVIKCGLKEAVEDEVLPEPTVYLLPLALDNTRFNYKIKKFGRTITTTQKGYYNDMSSLIEWYKNKFFNTRSERVKNLWLSTAGKRLKWCAEQKETLVLSLLDKFKNYKTLTFCSSIEQSERLGKYNITSKNKASVKNLEMFNLNKIKHITACNILNEGVNLTNCRIGIFCNLNSSEIVVKQRVGRILRHKSPIIIIPYFKDTREEELVQKMIEEYSEDSIISVNSINDIKL